MKYEIIGATLPAVELTLNRGESVYTQSGGLAKGFGRMLSGESMKILRKRHSGQNA